ncbi:hypothetical protein ES703_59604 [subsurface metagenome]
MALIRGKNLNTKKQAVDFLLKDRHLLIRPEVVDWFKYAQIHFSESELEEKSEELIGKQVRKYIYRSADWEADNYYIPGPYYKFVTSQHPFHYAFTLNLYLVASLQVYWTKSSRDYESQCVVIGPLKEKVQEFKLPLDFLEAISQGDLSQFEQKERDNQGYYTWHIPSIDQDIKLHGLLLKSLEDAFLGKPLGPALVYYGLASWEEGRRAEKSLLLMPSPSVAGQQLPQTSPPSAPTLVAPLCKWEHVEQALMSLGYKKSEVKEVSDAIFDPSLSLEDNVNHCLQYFGGPSN